jgi:hypothetical protein
MKSSKPFWDYTVDVDGVLCIVLGGAEVPLKNLIRMESVASTPSLNGGPHKVLLKATYTGAEKHFVVEFPSHIPFPFHRTTTILSEALKTPVSRIDAEFVPQLDASAFAGMCAHFNAGNR